MQNRLNNTRALVEAALIGAILVITMLVTIYVPAVYIITIFALPTPVTLIYVRQGFKYAIGSLVIAIIVGVMMIDPLTALSLGSLSGIIGITFGYCVRKDKKVPLTILLMSLSYIIVYGICFVLITMFINKNGLIGIIDDSVKTLNGIIESTKNTYLSMGVSKEQVNQMFSQLEGINRNVILWCIPGTLISAAVIFSYINYNITAAIFKRLRITIKDMIKFSNIYVPNMVTAFMIIIVCIGLILQRKGFVIGNYIYLSSMYLIQIAFLTSGLATVVYFLKNKYKLTTGATLAITIFSFFIFKEVFFFLGLIDSIADLRKLDLNRIGKTR